MVLKCNEFQTFLSISLFSILIDLKELLKSQMGL